MADITCIECNASVSDASGYCPECGYPFNSVINDANNDIVGDALIIPQQYMPTEQSDKIPGLLDSIRADIHELQRTVDEIKQDFASQSSVSAANTQKTLTEVTMKLDTIASALPKETKQKLLAAFYKTLNSPNSMFEYMFYICIVQIIFVTVSLFMVAYVVKLVR